LLAGAALLPGLVAAPALAASSAPPVANEDIVVTGKAVPGAVIGDIPPENSLNPADIAAYGVGTVSELLDQIAARTQSDQGRSNDGPVVLVNGKRVSGINEVKDLPTESVLRVDILPEEVALRYGYDAQAKVVNVILRRRVRARVGNLSAGAATQGQGQNGAGDVTWTRIRDNNRTNVALRASGQDSLLESDRGVSSDSTGAIDPTGTLGTQAAGRTLQPAAQTLAANATLARQLAETVNLSINAQGSYSASQALNGLATGTLTIPASNPFAEGTATSVDRILSADPLRQTTRTASAGTGVTLNADLSRRWHLSVIGSYSHGDTRTGSDRGYDTTALQTAIAAGAASVDPYGVFAASELGAMLHDSSTAISDSGGASVLVHGKGLRLPAGDAGLSLRIGSDLSSLRSRAVVDGTSSQSNATRRNTSGQVSLDLPLASRSKGVLPILGKVTANLNASVTQVSDYGTLGTFGYGLTWIPRDGISLIAAVNEDRSAPTLAQRSGPLVTTQNVRVFDQASGETVLVTQISGGNAALTADNRHVFKLGATVKPWSRINLTLTASYIEVRNRNAVISPGGATVALMNAFPNRYVRDAQGTLVSIDSRALNIAEQETHRLRWGLNFTQMLRAPKRPAPPPGLRPPWARAKAVTAPDGGPLPDNAASAADGMPPPPPGQDDAIVVDGNRPQDPSAPDGPPGPPPDGMGPPPDGLGPPPDGLGPPPPGMGPPPGGFGGPGGRGGPGGPGGFGGGDNGARLQFSVYHSWIFSDRAVLRQGTAAVDLLQGGTLSGSAEARHAVDFNLGVTDNGLGARLDGSWKNVSHMDSGTSAGSLRFAPLATFDVRLFVNLANRFPGKAWARGTRVSLSVQNLFNRRQRVTDSTGATPAAYQPAILDPLGRTVLLSMRRVFERGPSSRDAPRAAVAGALGLVEPCIGGLEQAVQRIGAVVADDGADAGGNADEVAVHFKRLGNRGAQALGEQDRFFRTGQPKLHDGEFIAAEPGHDVAVADRATQAIGHLFQQAVAGAVAIGIVDRLEAVEIEIMHGDQPVRGDDLGVGLEMFAQRQAVGQGGQVVAAGQRERDQAVPDLGLDHVMAHPQRLAPPRRRPWR
jgi:hypothetical protein